MRRRNLTKNQALAILCPEGGRHVGDNNLTFGGRTNYVRISLSTNGYCGHYELLKLKHIKADETVDVWTINITAERHIPQPHPRPDIQKGGHYWTGGFSENDFYCWEPVGVAERVAEILEFTGVLEPATV